MASNLRFGRMIFQNFGAFLGSHEFNWDQGPAFWFIAGSNKAEPELGANGAGKTTLVTALYWALTGQTLRNSRPGDRVEPWHGTGTTRVTLDFIRGNTPHTIVRQRKPNGLTLDSEPTTDDAIVKVLGVSPDVLLYTCIFGQNNTLFLDLKPEPQSALFTDLLGLDVWLEAANRAGRAAAAAVAERDKADREVAAQEGRLAELAKGEEECIRQETEYSKNAIAEAKKLLAEAKTCEPKADELKRDLDALPLLPDDTKEIQEEHDEAVKNMQAWNRIASTKAAEVEQMTARLNKISADHTSIMDLGNCPTCGQSLKDDSKHDLAKQLAGEAANIRTDRSKTAIAQAEAISQVNEWQEAVDEARTKLRDSREKREARRIEREKVERATRVLLDHMEALTKQANALKSADNPHTATLRLIRGRVAAAKTAKMEWLAKYEKAATDADTASFWRDGFRAIRLQIIEEALFEVAAAANRHCERLGLSGWQIEFSTERETKKGTTALGFATFLWPPEVETPIPFDVYSGGESQRLQLGISFGLGEVLLARAGVSTNVEILDEPTKGMSPEGISDLLECLGDRARDTERTIWMIDHHSVDRGSFDGTILVEKTSEGSRICQP